MGLSQRLRPSEVLDFEVNVELLSSQFLHEGYHLHTVDLLVQNWVRTALSIGLGHVVCTKTGLLCLGGLMIRCPCRRRLLIALRRRAVAEKEGPVIVNVLHLMDVERWSRR